MKNKNTFVFISFLVAGITTLSTFPSVISYQTAVSEISDIANTKNNHSTDFVWDLGDLTEFLRELIIYLSEHLGVSRPYLLDVLILNLLLAINFILVCPYLLLIAGSISNSWGIMNEDY